MKVLEVKLQNIRAIESLHWQLQPGMPTAGWHVILGDNGSGKSSFLRALAIGLLGLERTGALLLDYPSLIRQNKTEGRISLTIQQEEVDELDSSNSNASVMVLGIGGSGSNVVDRIYKQGIKGVEFAVCNTDQLALSYAATPNKVQLGHLGKSTEANYEWGRQATLESQKQLRKLLSNGTKLLLIIAGMGGGTGTGATPVIAELAKELGILTMAFVTLPYQFEGRKRRTQAEFGLRELRPRCDSMLTMNLDNLRQFYGNLTIGAAFSKADDLIMSAVKALAELLNTTTDVNIDFDDIRQVLQDSGTFLMGAAAASGENRGLRAAQEAFRSPFFQDVDLQGAKTIILSILSGPQAELDMDELSEITEFIQTQAGDDAEMIFGHGTDDSLGNSIQVTVCFAKLPDDQYQDKHYDLHRQYDLFRSLAGQTTLNFDQDSIQVSANEVVYDDKQQHNIFRTKYYQLQIDFNSAKPVYGQLATSTENGSRFIFESIWGRKSGWFSAGFGPFRRFTGGDLEQDKMYESNQNKKVASHLSLFKENVAFTRLLDWLLTLKLRSLEDKDSIFFTYLLIFINQSGFLPNSTFLHDVTSKGVIFKDKNGYFIGINDLSDGFRSVLSLAFELLRQLESEYKEHVFDAAYLRNGELLIKVNVSGVVLIDEIDAHLHPLWQKQIGYWLTKHFPNIQFFVTTHSPLVCQAAEHGSVFHLPRPGSDDTAGMVTGTELNRLIYGNVLEAYGTEVFGLITTQSIAGQEKTHRLTALNEKALATELSEEERQERDELRAMLPITDSEDFINKLLSDL